MRSEDIEQLQKFWDRLDALDWYYEYSDDRSVYQRGSNAMSGMYTEATESDDKRDLFRSFKDHKWNNTPKPPRPELPGPALDNLVPDEFDSIEPLPYPRAGS